MKALALPALALLLAAATAPAPTPTPSGAPFNEESEHVVQPGETLGGIATRAEVPRVLIIEANGLKAPYAVRTGQKLAIPRTRRHTVATGETGFLIAWKYGAAWQDIAVANGLGPDATLKRGQKLLIPTLIAPQARPTPAATPSPAATAPRFAWPLQGPIRRSFAPRGKPGYHDGIDITAAEGTAVRAIDAGKVLFAGEESSQFGRLVIVDHGGGLTSAYAFLSRVTVKEGDPVRKGERVGLVGHTGLARGSELHFELRRSNRPVDPEEQLPERE